MKRLFSGGGAALLALAWGTAAPGAALAASQLPVTAPATSAAQTPAALSRAVLVLRDATERPELIEAGAGLLVGTDTARIVAAVNGLLADPYALARMRQAINPFGDGRTSERIADVLQHDLDL